MYMLLECILFILRRYIESLQHASQCLDDNCKLTMCKKIQIAASYTRTRKVRFCISLLSNKILLACRVASFYKGKDNSEYQQR